MKSKSGAERVAIVEDLSQFGDVRRDYSGRGMFGAQCMGIVTDDPDTLKEEAVLLGLRGALVDNMGKQYIVYWPHVSAQGDAR